LRTYWDTSAAINAFVSAKVSARLNNGEHCIRVHLLSEFFATMTGRGILAKDTDGNPTTVRLSPSDAATWLRNFCARVSVVDVGLQETLEALDTAQKKNVQGGKVYDFLHAVAADKIGAVTLLTRNAKDFAGLAQKAAAEWP
jgi:hypothetical protein